MTEHVEKLGDRLRVTPGSKTQIGRTPAELLMVVNAVEWGIGEFDKSVTGEGNIVAPTFEMSEFLEAAYAIGRFITGEEPTHPMLANLLRVYKEYGQFDSSIMQQEYQPHPMDGQTGDGAL